MAVRYRHPSVGLRCWYRKHEYHTTQTDGAGGEEIADLKRQVEDAYHNELAAALEREVDKLIQDAANEAQRRAEEAAAAERDAMRQRMRDMLLTRAAV